MICLIISAVILFFTGLFMLTEHLHDKYLEGLSSPVVDWNKLNRISRLQKRVNFVILSVLILIAWFIIQGL